MFILDVDLKQEIQFGEEIDFSCFYSHELPSASVHKINFPDWNTKQYIKYIYKFMKYA